MKPGNCEQAPRDPSQWDGLDTYPVVQVEAFVQRIDELEAENNGLADRLAELEARCKRMQEIGDMIVDEYMVEKAEKDAWEQAKEAKP